jgi:hypothetical protein
MEIDGGHKDLVLSGLMAIPARDPDPSQYL